MTVSTTDTWLITENRSQGDHWNNNYDDGNLTRDTSVNQLN